MLSVWVIFKIGDRLVDTCDALSGQLAVYWVGRSDSNSRATFFPQSAPALTPLLSHTLPNTHTHVLDDRLHWVWTYSCVQYIHLYTNLCTSVCLLCQCMPVESGVHGLVTSQVVPGECGPLKQLSSPWLMGDSPLCPFEWSATICLKRSPEKGPPSGKWNNLGTCKS